MVFLVIHCAKSSCEWLFSIQTFSGIRGFEVEELLRLVTIGSFPFKVQKTSKLSSDQLGKKSFQDSLGNQPVTMKHHKGFEDDSLETGGLTTIELPTSCTSHVTVFEDCLVPFLRSARLNLEALGIGRNIKMTFVLKGVCEDNGKNPALSCRPFCWNMCLNLYQLKYGSKNIMIWVWNMIWVGSEIQIFNWRKITQSIWCMVSWGRYAKNLFGHLQNRQTQWGAS